MDYEIRFHPQADRELTRLSRTLRRELLQTHLARIAQDPYAAGHPLTGLLKGLWKYPFHHAGTAYRLVYEIDPEHRSVVLLMAGPREGLYARLLRRIGL